MGDSIDRLSRLLGRPDQTEAQELLTSLELVSLAVSPGGRPADDSPIGTPGGKQNWVDKAGGLPKYIRMIAHALIRDHGFTEDHAIATAKNRVVKLAATAKDPKVKAAAAAAVAEWEAKRAKSKAS